MWLFIVDEQIKIIQLKEKKHVQDCKNDLLFKLLLVAVPPPSRLASKLTANHHSLLIITTHPLPTKSGLYIFGPIDVFIYRGLFKRI